ncbi:glycoside hydrolase family 9 protein [Mucilaginibacter arboris]|uniref:Endoglucanase n=1 Tax=Mucilaginibacter arboris TaxID=2682090 RepID=A0A7K1SX16_9SPHI|nr:glycoside hydrolase family 9 protein [Mucilaginibacter arboris]MVN21871.1 cellulase [Mucilaginibacter arboris]
MKPAKLFLTSVFLSFGAVVLGQSSQNIIKIDQNGYYPNAPKIAVITSDYKTDEYAGPNFGFYVLKANVGDTVYKSKLSDVRSSANSSIKTRIADFSAFHQKGTFVIYVPGIGSSYPFKVDDDVHKDAATAILKGFYYIRSAMPLEEKYAGKWHRPAGHPDTHVLVHPSAASAKRPAGTVISASGGWYDAGDYNKYVVNSGISTGTLLSAYEDFPDYFTQLNTNIPESGNGVPDVLDEALYNIRWMMQMQDPNDGGVYNKCTNAAFDPMVRPGVTKLPRYVVQKGTAATLDFAAVAAQASRIFRKYNKQYPGLADSLLNAATYAWKWAEKNPALEYNQNLINQKFEPKITTGAYGDKSFKDEWFWAATELLGTTGKKVYYDTVAKHTTDPVSLPSWANVRMLGYYTLTRLKNNLPSFARGSADAMAKQIVAFADNYLPRIPENAFGTVMGASPREFNWGSNSEAANQGVALINAYLITKDKKYVDAALTNMDYLLGRNATGYCFVTGIGSRPTMRPHHRPSISDGIEDPVPGLMAGGPNPGMQDHAYYEHKEPETAYSDTDAAYASNEIAINWNAPAVYLFNAIEALQKKVGY